MNIQTERTWIHQEIDKLNDVNFIEKLKNLLIFNSSDKVETIEKYNVEIENALLSIKKGNYFSQEDARIMAKKWNRK
jgi:hypothetical protein